MEYNHTIPDAIAEQLGRQLASIRLSQNRTQAAIAREAGIARATLVRLEQGHGVSLDSFIRVLLALKLGDHLAELLPDPTLRPLDRVALAGQDRQRARPRNTSPAGEPWQWGDERD